MYTLSWELVVVNIKDAFHLTEEGNPHHTSPLWASPIIGTRAKIKK